MDGPSLAGSADTGRTIVTDPLGWVGFHECGVQFAGILVLMVRMLALETRMQEL
jgi:hypothetical protein